jgi:hypothetical protein
VSGDPGDARYTAVWVERPGPAWWAVHGLDAAACQARFDELTGQGYAPTILTATGPASGEIFAAAFEQGVDQPWFARHGLRWDPDTLTHENSRAYDQGYLPRCLACTETPRTGASPASGSRTSTPCCAVVDPARGIPAVLRRAGPAAEMRRLPLVPSRLPCPVHSGMATRKPPAGKGRRTGAAGHPIPRHRPIRAHQVP